MYTILACAYRTPRPVVEIRPDPFDDGGLVPEIGWRADQITDSVVYDIEINAIHDLNRIDPVFREFWRLRVIPLAQIPAMSAIHATAKD